MKKLLLWLLWIISLWLINFSSAWSVTYSWSVSKNIPSSSSTSSTSLGFLYLPIPSINYLSSDYSNSLSSILSNITCTISNFNDWWLNFVSDGWWFFNTVVNNVLNNSNFVSSYSYLALSNWVFSFDFSSSIQSIPVYFYLRAYYSRPNSSATVSFDYSCTITWDWIFSNFDCSTVEWQLNSCQSDLATATWNIATLTNLLNSCQSDLTNCQNTPSSPSCSSWSCTVSSYQDIVYSWTKTITQNSTTNIIDFWSSPNKTMCITLEWTMGNQNYVKLWFNNNATSVASDSQEYWYDQVWKTVCLYANKRYFNINNPKATNPEISYSIYFLNDLLNESVPCDEPQGEQCTQLKCENDYNLIPESSINSEYCEDRFNLIDPENCPASWWSGDVNWSSFFVNAHQVQGAENIYLRLPDFLNWDYTYIDSWTTLEVDVENEWDTQYIEDILKIQSYHPSSEDFTQSFTWTIILLIPYIIITLFIVFIWKLVKRIFK